MFVRHRVRGFAKWEPLFDEHEPARREHGLTGHSLLHWTDDPSDMMIAFRAGDPERAGVEGSPETWCAEALEEKRYS